MKLWLITPTPIGCTVLDYDCSTGFVVRALDEGFARRIAAKNAGCEGKYFWYNTAYARCEELPIEGEPGLILQAYDAG